MKTTGEIERTARELMLTTRIQQDLFDDTMMFVFINEEGKASATFTTFVEAYRYRLNYIGSKLDG